MNFTSILLLVVSQFVLVASFSPGDPPQLLQRPFMRIQQLQMAGFGAVKTAKDISLVVDSSEQCACSSGKNYGDCCGRFHSGGGPNPDTPEALVRARFTAFTYMKIGYLLDSTHPESKDYCLEEEVVGSKRTKRQIWKKQLEARAGELDFANLTFQDDGGVEMSQTGETAVVSLSLDRKPKSSKKYDKCVEKITCKKATDGGWMYMSGRTEVTEENNPRPKQVKITNKKK